MESTSSKRDIVGICFSIRRHRWAEEHSKDDLTDQRGQPSDNIRRREVHDQRGPAWKWTREGRLQRSVL